MYGGTDVFVPIYILVALGVIVVLGSVWARKTGRLQSRGGKMVVAAVVALIAVMIWVGPAMFLME